MESCTLFLDLLTLFNIKFITNYEINLLVLVRHSTHVFKHARTHHSSSASTRTFMFRTKLSLNFPLLSENATLVVRNIIKPIMPMKTSCLEQSLDLDNHC
jgi:hypothetical protein